MILCACCRFDLSLKPIERARFEDLLLEKKRQAVEAEDSEVTELKQQNRDLKRKKKEFFTTRHRIEVCSVTVDRGRCIGAQLLQHSCSDGWSANAIRLSDVRCCYMYCYCRHVSAHRSCGKSSCSRSGTSWSAN